MRICVVAALAFMAANALAAPTILSCTFFEATLDPDTGRISHKEPEYGAVSVIGAFSANEVSYHVALPALRGLGVFVGDIKINRSTLEFSRVAEVRMPQVNIASPVTVGNKGTCWLLPSPKDRKF